MIDIFVHRAILDGKENSKDGVVKYIQLGFGIELDLRCDSRGVYLSHDPSNYGELFSNVCSLLKNSKSLLALHIKELSCIEKIVELLKKHDLTNCFLFDSDYDFILNKSSNYEVAFYADCRPKKVGAHKLWCDEIKEKWYSKNLIEKLHDEGKILYAVSRELVMPSSFTEIVDDWQRLLELGFDGICTNYPEEIKNFLESHNK